ncbi:hypothetical protein BJY01DRAFT_261584 [Aspergillus pseudoustus]|uniref:ER-bound oxygenase mpaB/mpaB'/Rubber oxygenase catalytic domain-containing protein n=1 Tax=Aspergillus pseudoustus TaxID=1810923 RepID=A0ABR4KDE6_9EURO
MAAPTTQTTRNRILYHYWGYSFEWTSLHRSKSELEPWTRTCDTLADDALEVLNEIPSPSGKAATAAAAEKPTKRDLYAVLRENYRTNPKLEELWAHVNTVPDWVDWDQIRRGQNVFYRYGIPINNVLLYESLLGGMAALSAPQILSLTGGFAANVVRRRLLETVQHTLQVTRSVESIKPGGDGHISSVRVRLLHSNVRNRILTLAAKSPQYYDVKKYGIPANDLDSLGTIVTFSTLVVWVGLPRQGIVLSKQEIEDYIALWRLVAHYMGAPTDPFRDLVTARAYMESILVSEFQPNDTGRILAQNIVLGLENTPPTYTSKGYMEAMARLLNGDELADQLHLPRSNFYYKCLMFGYCVLVRLMAHATARSGFVDRFIIATNRRLMWHHLIDGKDGLGKETTFTFKYIPNLKRSTRPGQQKQYSLLLKRPGFEVLSYAGLLSTILAAVAITSILRIVLRAAAALTTTLPGVI